MGSKEFKEISEFKDYFTKLTKFPNHITINYATLWEPHDPNLLLEGSRSGAITKEESEG